MGNISAYVGSRASRLSVNEHISLDWKLDVDGLTSTFWCCSTRPYILGRTRFLFTGTSPDVSVQNTSMHPYVVTKIAYLAAWALAATRASACLALSRAADVAVLNFLKAVAAKSTFISLSEEGDASQQARVDGPPSVHR